jgi:hypothetical protein
VTRNFTHRLATRDKTPLLVSLVGPSSSGKTKSGLRLAAGFKRVNPGKIFVVDTEAGRSLQYADEYEFEHVPFGAPFAPLDYLDVIKYCVENGASTVIVDSMSHEHEGPGGLLEMQAADLKAMGGQMSKQGLAWQRPKSEHRRMLNTILQFNCNFIFCFRAKQKLDWNALDANGKKLPPQPLGFMAIGDEAWMFEMTMQCLLMPGCKGVPTWNPSMPGEKESVKRPGFFEGSVTDGAQLSEDIGEAMAKWSAGTSSIPKMTAAQMIAEYAACSEPTTFRRLEEIRKVSWSAIASGDKPSAKAASELAAKRIEDAAKAPEPQVASPDDEFSETAAAS